MIFVPISDIDEVTRFRDKLCESPFYKTVFQLLHDENNLRVKIDCLHLQFPVAFDRSKKRVLKALKEIITKEKNWNERLLGK